MSAASDRTKTCPWCCLRNQIKILTVLLHKPWFLSDNQLISPPSLLPSLLVILSQPVIHLRPSSSPHPNFCRSDTSLSWVLLVLCSPRRTVIHVPALWLGVPGIKVHGRWWSLLQCPWIQGQWEQLRSSRDGELVWLCAFQLSSPWNCLVSKWPWPLVIFHSSLSPANMATGHEKSWASFWEHIILEDKDGGIV